MLNLPANLNQLESSDLVRRLYEDELAYLIKHALVQETAQDSLLKHERKRLNRLVAETMERVYADRLDEFAARLFQHYDAAGHAAKAITYAERAGDAAFHLSAYDEAVSAYRRALELANAREDDSETIIRLMTQLGRAYELQPNYDPAIALYIETRDRARTRRDRSIELAALVQLAKVLSVAAMRYDPQQAQDTAHEALQLARSLGDQHAEARILWIIMLSNLYGAGGAQQGVVYGEQSLALARALNWREQMAYSLNDLAYTHINLGDLKRAAVCSSEARALWRELDNKPMLTDNLNAAGMTHLLRGEFQAALALAHEARTLSQVIGSAWGETTSYMIEGYIELLRGGLDKSLDAFHQSMLKGDVIGIHGPIVMARFESAQMCAFLGDWNRADDLARDSLERTHRQAINWNGWAYATLALIADARGDEKGFQDAAQQIGDAPNQYFLDRILPMGAVAIVIVLARSAVRRAQWEKAHTRLEDALTRIQQSENVALVPTVLHEIARTWLAQRNFAKAHSALEQAEELAARLNSRRTRLEIAYTRFELAQARGDGQAIHAAQRAGSARLLELLPSIPESHRASFLQTASARVFHDA